MFTFHILFQNVRRRVANGSGDVMPFARVKGINNKMNITCCIPRTLFFSQTGDETGEHTCFIDMERIFMFIFIEEECFYIYKCENGKSGKTRPEKLLNKNIKILYYPIFK